MEPEHVSQEALDQRYDVTLVIENGKEFQAHRQVLSKASPFFEKLLNSDMKEANEGIVRLEMVSESSMRDVLEFIYTDNVRISAKNARELIAMADYFLLPELKGLAERILTRSLNILNCVSTYHFAKTNRGDKLIFDTKKFILANFTSVAKTEEFLNSMSPKEVEMWITTDEIDVSAEEDVFKFILTWIDRDKLERKKRFSQLFRHVRLVYISRDYLRSDVVTSDFVKDNEGCLDLVKEALRFIDSGKYEQSGFVRARNCLEIPVMVGYSRLEGSLSCYFPRENRWCCLPLCKLPQYKAELSGGNLEVWDSVSSHGKIYLMIHNPQLLHCHPGALPYLFCYDSLSNSWNVLPFEDSLKVRKLFVGSNDGIYAMVSADDLHVCPACLRKVDYLRQGYTGGSHSMLWDVLAYCPGHTETITKYNPESNSWENITSFDMLQKPICIVAKDNYLYFIGGREVNNLRLKDAERFDLSNKTWEKIADVQDVRWFAVGAVAHGKIFVTEGDQESLDAKEIWRSCEMYDESTNQWQYISSRLKTTFRLQSVRYGQCVNLVCADDQLYAVTSVYDPSDEREVEIEIVCYHPNRGEWQYKTTRMDRFSFKCGAFCSVRVFKGSKFLNTGCTPDACPSLVQLSANRSSESLTVLDKSTCKCKCAII